MLFGVAVLWQKSRRIMKTLGLLKQQLQTVLFSFYTFTWSTWSTWGMISLIFLPWQRCPPSVQSWNWGISGGQPSLHPKGKSANHHRLAGQPGGATTGAWNCADCLGISPNPIYPTCVWDTAWKHFFGYGWNHNGGLSVERGFLFVPTWHMTYGICDSFLFGVQPTDSDGDNLTFKESQTKQHRAMASTLSLQTLGSTTSSK